MIGFKKLAHKITNLLLALFIISAQLFAPISAIIPKASAVDACEVDIQGADDEPGQKDLTQMCSDIATASSGFITVKWNWDDTAWSGNNSGDACALFDTDNDTFANYSLCAVVKNSPAQIVDTRVYACSDGRVDRCTNSNQDNTITSSCTVSIGDTDPFNGSNDTTATCTIQLSDVGGIQAAELIDVCSYPSQQPNSDPSDCIIATTRATVEVIKQIVPETNQGKFDLFIDGVKYVDDGGDGSTTGPKVVDDTKDIIVKEEPGLNTLLTNYTTSLSCMNQDNELVASGTPTGTGSRQATITHQEIAKGDTIVCTFTNTLQNASIQVVKDVINDNGGTKTYADFTFQVNGGTAQTFEETTSPDGARTISVPIGSTYTVTEPEANLNGYSTSYSGCTDITPVVGQTQVCTITNNDNSPSLTLNKILSNAHGGNATESDWTLTATGPTTISGAGAAGSADVVSGATFSAGTYTLSESAGPAGYAASSWTCTNGVTVNGSSQITLANGQATVCSITNSEIAPVLTLIKNVTNNSGGTSEANDFVLRLNGTAQTSPVLSNSNLTATYSVASPTSNTEYTVSEDANTSYAGSAVTCVDNTTLLAVSHPVTLNEGQSVTCTITNDDISPTLQLIKSVINDDGGIEVASSWTLTAQEDGEGALIDETGVSTDGGETAETGTYDAIAGIAYTLSESSIDGYSSDGVWSCTGGGVYDDITKTITLDLAENVICTITNDDIAPTLTVVKRVVNDNGGAETVEDFGLTIDGDPLAFDSGVANGNTTTYTATPTVAANTDYDLSENDVDGYSEGTWDCGDSQGVGQSTTVNLDLDEDIVCTIINDDVAPVLTLRKTVVSENEDHDSADWTLTATPTTGGVISGNGEDGVENEQTVAGVNYTLTESTELDQIFDASDWVCTSSAGVFSNPNGINNEIRMSVGANVTCTITNTERATVIVTKYNDYNRNGTQDQGEPVIKDWGFTLDETPMTTGQDGSTTFTNVRSDESHQLSETIPTGSSWQLSNIDCGERQGSLDGDTYFFSEGSIEPGETVNCFVGNYRDAYMLIEKTNNRPEPTVVGDTVTYTLTVTVPEDSNPVYDAIVTDLPPEGFNYIPGSETATQGSLTTPYASPGIWSLGDLFPGDVVVLTYKTLIANSASAGTYPDLAFASGCDEPALEGDCEVNIYANVTNVDEEGTPFVGTEVTIKAPQVLAANTTVLVNTGAGDIWRNLAVGTLLMGVALATLYRREKKGYKL
jgi:uncharacterized repeat protein (TIGR01451 family)